MRQGEAVQRQVVVVLGALALCAGAAVLIVKIAGEDPDLTIARVAYIAVALALLGLGAASGLHLAERRPGLAKGFGYLTAAVALATFVLIVVEIAGDGPLDATVWPGVALALTLALAQASLALTWARSDDPPLQQLVTAAAVLVVLGAGGLVAVEVGFDRVSISPKVFGVVAVLYLLSAALVALFGLTAWSRRRSEVGSVPLDHVVIAVSDRDAAIRFYTGLLGAEVVPRPEGRIALRVGEQLLNVHEPGVQPAPLAREPVRPGNSDLCFAWPGSPQLAVEMVRALGAELVEGPVPRTGARGPGKSVYCRDPDGSLIELISYA